MNINIERLTVRYNHQIVGFLQDIGNGLIAYQYDRDWVSHGFSISPLSLPLSDQVYISKSQYFQGLFGVFHDSLPDGWGELLVRRMLAKKGIHFDKLTALTRLSLIGENGLGALSYEPTQSEKSKETISNLDRLADDVKSIYNFALDYAGFDEIYRLGGASGGARPKIHTDIEGEAWIIKFPASMNPVDIGTLEFLANQHAKDSGIHVNTFNLFPSQKCKGYFGAKRFDRADQKRIHMISLSSLLETTYRIPNLDYAHLFQVIQKICVNQEDLYEAFKRMCFNVLYGNKDDHGKNFAFLYDDDLKGYKLSPFYDITQTQDKVEHEMTVLGNGRPVEKDLIKMAETFHLSMKKCKAIIESIKKVIE